jgi:hypothetical protein
MVLKDDVGRTTSVLAGIEADGAALEVAIEGDWAEEVAGWEYIPALPPPPTTGVDDSWAGEAAG